MYTIPITFRPSPDSIVQTPTPWGKESDQLYHGPPELVPPSTRLTPAALRGSVCSCKARSRRLLAPAAALGTSRGPRVLSGSSEPGSPAHPSTRLLLKPWVVPVAPGLQPSLLNLGSRWAPAYPGPSQTQCQANYHRPHAFDPPQHQAGSHGSRPPATPVPGWSLWFQTPDQLLNTQVPSSFQDQDGPPATTAASSSRPIPTDPGSHMGPDRPNLQPAPVATAFRLAPVKPGSWPFPALGWLLQMPIPADPNTRSTPVDPGSRSSHADAGPSPSAQTQAPGSSPLTQVPDLFVQGLHQPACLQIPPGGLYPEPLEGLTHEGLCSPSQLANTGRSACFLKCTAPKQGQKGPE